MAYLLIELKCFTFFKLKNKNLADTKNMTLRVPYFVKYTCILGDILYNMVVYICMIWDIFPPLPCLFDTGISEISPKIRRLI